MNYKYIWSFEILKATEEGIGTATLKRIIPRKGEREINTCPSAYMGHTHTTILCKDYEAKKAVQKILFDYGYTDKLRSEYGWNKI